ncbi:hypothetical protein ACFLX5_03860 [Chloroflexota bacterium]
MRCPSLMQIDASIARYNKTKAQDLARGSEHSLGVKPSYTLQTALEQMIATEEVVLPVLDKSGKVLDDLRLSEVLLKAIEVGKDVGP